MRNTHKAILAAVVAIAAMALGASSASAVTLSNESEGAACGSVAISGHSVVQSGQQCPIHATSTEQVDLELIGINISSCNNEFDSNFGSNGVGYLHNQVLTGASCTVTVCAETNGLKRPWPATISEAAGSYSLAATFCVQRSNGDQVNCTVNVPTTVTGHSLATFSGESPELNCAGTGGALQVHGNWTTELGAGEDEIEIAM